MTRFDVSTSLPAQPSIEPPRFFAFADIDQNVFAHSPFERSTGRFRRVRNALGGLPGDTASAYQMLPFLDVASPLATEVRRATSRVWVLDPHIGKRENDNWCSGVVSIALGLAWGESNLDVRVLSQKMPDELQIELLWAASNLAMSGRERASSVEWRRYKGKLMHDRACVVDDVLWHFGATVGGLHPTVNACSTGWNAEEYGFSPFFEGLWLESAEGKLLLAEERQLELREQLR